MSIAPTVWALLVTLVGGFYTVWKFRHYVRDIALGLVSPSRVSWSVWMATTVIAVVSAVAAGATAGLVVAGSAALSVGGVLAATVVPAGVRARLRRRAGLPVGAAPVDVRTPAQVWIDRVCLALSGLTLGVWAVLSVVDVPDAALYALVAITATDGIAAVPTLARALRGEEEADPFIGFAASAVATFLVLTEPSAPNVIYPAYQLTICTIIAVICTLRAPAPGGAHRRPVPWWVPTVRRTAVVGSGAAAVLGMVALLVGLLPLPAPAGSTSVPPPVLVLDGPDRAGVHRAAHVPAGPPSAAVPAFRGAPVPVGPRPGFVALTPSQRQAWVAQDSAGAVSVVDLASGRVAGAPVGVLAGPPRSIAFCPDGRRAYVSVSTDGAPDAPHVVAVLDVATSREVAEIPVGRRPGVAACSADGSRLVVPSHDDGVLDVVDTARNTVVDRVRLAAPPHGVAAGPDGRWWAADHESGTVTLLSPDLRRQAVVRLDTLPGVGACRAPQAVAVGPDGARAAVACSGSAQVYLLDGGTGAPTGAVDVGDGPRSVAWTADGRRVWSADARAGVSVVDADTRTRTALLAGADARSPVSVALTRDGTTGVVANLDSGSVSIVDAAVPTGR